MAKGIKVAEYRRHPAMLVDREVKIMNFEKEQYYMAHILMDGIDAMTERIDDKARAESIAAACESQSGVVRSVIKENKSVAPPKLYDLTTLQRDANRILVLLQSRHWSTPRAFMRKSWSLIRERTASIYPMIWKKLQKR